MNTSVNQKVLATTQMLTTEIDWNAVPTSETQYKKLKSTGDDLVYLGTENSEVDEYFVVDEEEVNVKSLFVQGPNVHIILCDGAKLHFKKEIKAYEGHTIYIHAQSSGSSMGKLVNDSDNDESGGLGGSDDNMEVEKGGNIEIHGGNLDLYGGNDCAAIGGNYKQSVGDISIFDGHIKVVGGDASAGIGAGKNTHNYGNINIYDGVIDATGGPVANIFYDAGGAGIGGGEGANGGFVKIHGGYVYAGGNSYGSGIGAGQDGNGGEITIDITSGNPLYVEAVGGSDISIWAGSIGSNDSEKFGTLNIGNGVKTRTYNYNESYWETIKVENHPVTYVHERRKAVLFTCDHAGYTPPPRPALIVRTETGISHLHGLFAPGRHVCRDVRRMHLRVISDDNYSDTEDGTYFQNHSGDVLITGMSPLSVLKESGSYLLLQ